MADIHRGVVRHSSYREREFADLLGDGLERLEVSLALAERIDAAHDTPFRRL